MIRFFFLVSIIAFLILSLVSGIFSELSLLFLIVSFSLLCFIPIVININSFRYNMSIHSPDILTGFVFFVYIGYGTFMMYFFPELRRNSTVDNESLYLAVIFCFFSLLFLYVGYYNKFNLRINLFPFYRKMDLKVTPRIILYFFIIGILGKMVEIFSGYYYLVKVNSIIPYFSPNSLFGFANFGPILSIFGIFSFLYSHNLYSLTKRKIYLFFFILIFLFEILSGLPTGSKEKLIRPVIYFILYLSFVNKLSLKFLIIFAILVIFFVFPFVSIYRSSDSNLSNVFSSYFRSENFSYSEDKSLELGNRLSGVAIVASIIDQTPEIHEFTYGRDYLNIFVALIPRVFWPDKPIVLNQNEFGRKYDLVGSKDYVTSVTPYWFGEAYINFSFFGVFIGFFYGLFLKNLKNIYLLNPNILTLFIMLVAIYIYSRHSQFISTILGVLQGYVIIILICFPYIIKSK